MHNSEIRKAENDKLNMDVANISGYMKSIETLIGSMTKDINKNFVDLSDSIEDLKSGLNLVEQVSGRNLIDIAKLKAIK